MTVDALKLPLKGILVEKPLGHTAESGRRILDAIKARKLPMAVPLGVLIRGSRGEIRDYDFRYLEAFDRPERLELLRQNAGEDGNLEGLWHNGYSAGAEWVYRNPFPYASLSDDEIAIATVLAGVQAYMEGGPEIYSFAEAAQDQGLSLGIDEALKTGQPVRTPDTPWSR